MYKLFREKQKQRVLSVMPANVVVVVLGGAPPSLQPSNKGSLLPSFLIVYITNGQFVCQFLESFS
jgi:hypothetical protein